MGNCTRSPSAPASGYGASLLVGLLFAFDAGAERRAGIELSNALRLRWATRAACETTEPRGYILQWGRHSFCRIDRSIEARADADPSWRRLRPMMDGERSASSSLQHRHRHRHPAIRFCSTGIGTGIGIFLRAGFRFQVCCSFVYVCLFLFVCCIPHMPWPWFPLEKCVYLLHQLVVHEAPHVY